jgi:hypothetical protein
MWLAYMRLILRPNFTDLDICCAERRDAGYFGAGYTWRLKTEHGLEIAIQLCHRRCHGDGSDGR